MTQRMWMMLCAAFVILHSSLFISCSESDDTVDEYANWQQRNEEFFLSLEDSLAANPAVWAKFKSYSKDQSPTTGTATDFIYVKKISSDPEASEDSPVATDSVMVSYEGRLIPTASYPTGYVFDTRAYGSYDMRTNAVAKMVPSGLVNGFATALYHMHRGDYWRVYIPYTLGYGATAQTYIPAYSTLIFDLTLIDFSPVGQSLPTWKAPRKP